MTANDEKQKKFNGRVAIVVILCCIASFFAGAACVYCGMPDTKKASAENSVGSENANEKKQSKSKRKSADKNAEENKRLATLAKDMDELFTSRHKGAVLSLYIENLDTGAHAALRNQKMNSASMIKLFIMQAVYDDCAKNGAKLSQEEKQMLHKMIAESDNKCANYFVDKYGGENEKRKITEKNGINRVISESGYSNTELNRKMHDVTPPEGPSGYENYTSVCDVAKLLRGIYKKELLGSPYDEIMLSTLLDQERTNKIPFKIKQKYPTVRIANKTGELSQTENDAAIIMGDGYNYIFVVMTDNIPKKENGDTDYKEKERVCETISDMGLMLLEFNSPSVSRR